MKRLLSLLLITVFTLVSFSYAYPLPALAKGESISPASGTVMQAGTLPITVTPESGALGADIYIDETLIKSFNGAASSFSYTADTSLLMVGRHIIAAKIRYEKEIKSISSGFYISSSAPYPNAISYTLDNVESGETSFYNDCIPQKAEKINIKFSSSVEGILSGENVKLYYCPFGKKILLPSSADILNSTVTVTPLSKLEGDTRHVIEINGVTACEINFNVTSSGFRGKVYGEYNFDNEMGVTPSYQGGNISQSFNGGNGRLHFAVPSGEVSNSYVDADIADIKEADEYIVEATVTPVKVENSSYIGLFDAKNVQNNTWRLGAMLKSDHTIMMNYGSNWIKIGNWQENRSFRLSVAYNVLKGRCSIYINGTIVMQNLNCGVTRPDKFRIDLCSKTGDGNLEFYIDDFYVYGGNVVRKPDTTVFCYNDYDDSDESSSLNGSSQSIVINSGGTIEPAAVDGNNMLHFSVAEGTKSGSYSDVSNPSIQGEDEYVIETLIKPVAIENRAFIELFDAKDSLGQWRLGTRIQSDHKIMINDRIDGWKQAGSWLEGVPFTYALLYNVKSGSCDVYINNQLTLSNVNIGTTRPYIFRIDLNSAYSDGNLDFYIDDLKIYSGSQIISDFQDHDAVNSIMDNHEVTKKALGDAWAFSCNDYYYMNGIKEKYTTTAHKPLLYNGAAYVSDEFLKDVLGYYYAKVSDSAASVVIDGKSYRPAAELAAVTGRKYLFDERGFFILSPQEFEFVNSELFVELFETSDLIYRFLTFTNPRGEEIMSDFNQNMAKGQHPRILLTDEDIAYINQKRESDSKWQEVTRDLIASADSSLSLDQKFTSDCLDANKQSQATEFQTVIERLSQAYLLTKDTKYVEAGLRYMKTLCSWQDLGFTTANLTTGHWCMGMAVGYDSFYDYLITTEEGRAELAAIREAAINMPFSDTLRAYRGGGGVHWINIRDNFQGVIGGGVMSLALVMADEMQDEGLYTEMMYLLENLIKSMEIAVSLYEPNGGYFEGVGYSEYMLGNLVKGMEAMFHCCGSDYLLGNAQGFTDAGDFYVYMQTPKYRMNFHDCSQNASATMQPAWFALRYGKTTASEMTVKQNEIRGRNPDLLGLLYYSKACDLYGNTDVSTEPLDRYYPVTETGSFRNSFDSKTPTFVGIHGGWTRLTHDMLDVGEFVFESDGIRWATDLGSDSYDLPSYFGLDGYKVYRKRPEGENCVVINPDGNYYGQELSQHSDLLCFESKNKAAKAAYDLSAIYGRDVNSYKRGYYFGDDRNTLLVQDEISLKKSNSEIYWFMHTASSINVIDNNTAILTSGGKQLRAEVYCSAGNYELLNMAAEPLPTSPVVEGQAVNTGIRKLAVHCNNAVGNVTIAVKLIPISEFYDASPLSVTPIESWTLPDGEREVKALISDAVVDICNSFTANVQMPLNATWAKLYIDGNFASDIEVRCGKLYSIGSTLTGIWPGEHIAKLRIQHSDGSITNVQTSFNTDVDDSSMFYQNSLSSSYKGTVPSGWSFSTAGYSKSYTDGYLTVTSDGVNYNALDLRTSRSDKAISGIIEAQCDIKFSSLSGDFEIECKNSAFSWYMNDIKLFDNGKMANKDQYSTDTWYTVKLIINSELKTCSVYVNDKMVLGNYKIDVADSNTLLKWQYVTSESGNSISYKNLRVKTYESVDYDFGVITFSKEEMQPGEITATVSGKLSSQDKEAILTASVVNKESGDVTDVDITFVSYSEENDSYTAVVTVPDDYENYEVRAMLWDNYFAPLTGVVRLDS